MFRNPRICTLLRNYSSFGDIQTCEAYLAYCKLEQKNLTNPHFKGTLYELAAKECLEKHFNCYDMTRVGGAGDNGVDLFGKWDLTRYISKQPTVVRAMQKVPSTSIMLVAKQHPLATELAPVDLKNDVTVLVQCKNYSSKLQATTIRELAGIYEFHVKSKLDRMKVFFFLVSPHPLTKQGMRQMDASMVPMVHIKLQPYKLVNPLTPDYNLAHWVGNDIGKVYLNPKARKLLKGLEVAEKLRIKYQ